MKEIDFKNIVFMKYGIHASEEAENIITRKQREFMDTGKMYWGYGGCSCHPKTQIQPFLKHTNGKVYLLLSKTSSNPGNSPIRSKQYSVDKIIWKDIPDGINVIGSKYAIVCGELKECNITIDLSKYRVPIGSSKGKHLSNYIKGQCDKACGVFYSENNKETSEVLISYYAEILEPYAVFIK